MLYVYTVFCHGYFVYFKAKIVEGKYLGRLSIVSLLHIGTETLYGVNLDSMEEPDVNYTVLIPANFYEFLPVEEYGEKSPPTVLAHQVRNVQCFIV